MHRQQVMAVVIERGEEGRLHDSGHYCLGPVQQGAQDGDGQHLMLLRGVKNLSRLIYINK